MTNKPWKKEDVDILVELKNQGLTPSQITKTGLLPRYSRNGIRKKMATILKDLSPSRLELFKAFLKENWQGKTPQELVALWNISNDLKVETQDVVHHLKELKILASKEEVERVKQLKIKEEQIKKKKTTSSVATTELLRLARVDVMQQRISERKDIWTGLPLEGEDLSEIVLLS